MAKVVTATQIKSLMKAGKAGRHSAGNGLYFRISAEGSATWVVRYSIHGKRREITLDTYPSLSLADAYGNPPISNRSQK